MALTTVNSATQTCTVTTEHLVGSAVTTAGTYVFQINLVNAVNGDAFRIRIYTKTLTGDTSEPIWDVVYANDQGVNNIIHSPPWVSMFSTQPSITQTAGTSRNVPWALIQVAS